MPFDHPAVHTLAVIAWLSIPHALQAEEPSREFELTVNGQTSSIQLDTPTTLTLDGHTLEVVLSTPSDQHFAIEGLSFRYPQHVTLKTTTIDGITFWTLRGNTCAVTLIRPPSPVPAAPLIEHLTDALTRRVADASTRTSVTSLRVGDQVLTGVRVEFSLAGHAQRHDLLPMGEPDAVRLLLVIQDTPRPSGEPSTEASRVLEHLANTLHVDPQHNAAP